MSSRLFSSNFNVLKIWSKNSYTPFLFCDFFNMAIIYNLAASSSGLTCFLAPSPIALPPAVFWAAERSNLFVFWASDLFVFYHSDDDDDDDTDDYGDDNVDDWGGDYSFSLALTPINNLDLFSEPLTICLSLNQTSQWCWWYSKGSIVICNFSPLDFRQKSERWAWWARSF